METRTLDTIVREKLNMIGYPIHYYLNFLIFAQVGLGRLSKNHNFGGNVKEIKEAPLTYGRVIIPADAIDVISVFGVVAGERKEFVFNPNLTLFQKLNGATPVKWLESDNSLPEYNSTGSSGLLEQTSPYEIPTIYYPDGQVDYEYTVDQAASHIIFGPRVEVTEVYIRYLSNGVSGTSANLVHPYAVDALFAFMDWSLAEKERRPQSEIIRKRSDFFNECRILRGNMNPLTLSQLYHILITG